MYTDFENVYARSTLIGHVSFSGLLYIETAAVETKKNPNEMCSHNEFYDDEKVNTIHGNMCKVCLSLHHAYIHR